MPQEIDALIKRTLAGPPKEGVVSIGIFGSMARGTASLGSDLDLFVVLANREGKMHLEPRIEKLRLELWRSFHLALSPYAETVADLRLKHKRKLPLILEILKDGRVIHGKEIKELLS